MAEFSQDDINKIQEIVLKYTTENNPYLPTGQHPTLPNLVIASNRYYLDTSKKNVIQAINELLLRTDNYTNLFKAFKERFDNIIGNEDAFVTSGGDREILKELRDNLGVNTLIKMLDKIKKSNDNNYTEITYTGESITRYYKLAAIKYSPDMTFNFKCNYYHKNRYDEIETATIDVHCKVMDKIVTNVYGLCGLNTRLYLEQSDDINIYFKIEDCVESKCRISNINSLNKFEYKNEISPLIEGFKILGINGP